jgi:hypothetical protein
MVDDRAIEQEHVSRRAPVLIEAVSLKRDFFSEDKSRGGLLGTLTVGLAVLRTVDAVESDAKSAGVVQDFDGVSVEYGDNGASEVGERGIGKKKEDETCQ